MLISTLRRTIGRFDLAKAGSRVVVALSGGADSVALTYLVRELEAAGDLTLAGLAHFNHLLRVEPDTSGVSAADRDERFCVSLAERMGVPILVERVTIKPRRFCCGCCVEPVLADLPRCTLAAAPSSGR